MYGYVNLCLEHLIQSVLGIEILKSIHASCNVFFVPHVHYPDAITQAFIDQAIKHKDEYSKVAWYNAIGDYLVTYLTNYGMQIDRAE